MLCALAGFASARADAPDGPVPQPPAERVGPSEVVGKSAPALVGLRSSSFRVYAFRNGSAAPIPFQVDERDRRGHWADDEGAQPVRDDTPGVFDDNDVIVFMNRTGRQKRSRQPPARRREVARGARR